MKQPSVFLNGQLAETISVFDRGLQFGDGVFETLLFQNGKLYLANRHWQRLQSGLRCLSIDCPKDRLDRELAVCLSHLQKNEIQTAVLKIIVTRGASQRGYAYSREQSVSVLMCLSPYSVNSEAQEHGVSVRICQQRLGDNPQLAGVKHLNRLEQVLAKSEWRDDDVFEGLMLDQKGRVIEGTKTNLFLVDDTGLVTPDLSRCGVAGTMRAEIIESIARSLGLNVRVGECEMTDLRSAKEVFICNSVSGVLPVTCLVNDSSKDNQRIENQWPIGQVTRAIQDSVNVSMGS